MIIGHQKQITFLKKILNSGKIPHALLFSGPEKIGKKKVAFEFASWILGENIFSHPDFLFIEPKENSIQIDQIRDLIWKIELKPFVAKKKIAILDKAHLMTKEAQNCFLKTLEEPPKDSIIILVSSFPALLLSTIISRCQKIRFFPPKRDEIEKFLKEKGISKKEREKILKICRGKVGLVFDILEKGKLKEIEEMEKNLEKFEKMSLFEKFEFLKQLKEEKIFLEFLISRLENEIFVPDKRKKTLSLLKFLQLVFSQNLISKVDKKMAFEILLAQF